MRISQRMVFQNMLRGIRNNLQTLQGAGEDAATGRKVHRLSDAPTRGGEVLRIQTGIRSVDRYRGSIVSLNTSLAAQESVLAAIEDLILQAKALATRPVEPSTDPQHDALVREAEILHEQMVSLGNTELAGGYLFGGGETRAKPFQDDGTYVGDDGIREIEVISGFRVPATQSGGRLLSPTLEAVTNLRAALDQDDRSVLEAALADLNSAAQEIRTARGEIGSRMKQVADIDKQLMQKAEHLMGQQADITLIDPAEAILKLSESQGSLERAYAAISRVISTNILDYLR